MNSPKVRKKLRALNSQSDSLYITIPKYLVDIIGLKPNQDVDILVRGSKIIVETKIVEEEN